MGTIWHKQLGRPLRLLMAATCPGSAPRHRAPSALLPPPPPLARRPAPPSLREPSPRGLEHLRGPRTRFCADGRRRPRGVPEPGPRAWGQARSPDHVHGDRTRPGDKASRATLSLGPAWACARWHFTSLLWMLPEHSPGSPLGSSRGAPSSPAPHAHEGRSG